MNTGLRAFSFRHARTQGSFSIPPTHLQKCLEARLDSNSFLCPGSCGGRRGCACRRGGSSGFLHQTPADGLEFLLCPSLGAVLGLLPDLRDEILGDGRCLVAPFVAHIGEDGGDLLILEHLAPRGHHVVELLAFHADRSLKTVKHDFHNMVVPVPILREHPFAADKRRKLPWNPQSRLLVANRAGLSKDALADDHWIGRRGRPAASYAIPSHARGIEDAGLEAAAVPEKVARRQKREDEEGNNQPRRHSLRPFAGTIRFAKKLLVLLYKIDLLCLVV